MKAAETLQGLIEEFKLRTVYWALCVFAVSYFLTHTSKSMWMNVPISILFVCGLRVLLNEVEFRWKVRKVRQLTYLAHLEKQQLAASDSRPSTPPPPPPKWERKIDSPIVRAAMEGFVDKLLQDFVTDMWYSDITPDKEAPELMRAIIMDVLGEISGRLKEINLVDLLTRDIVELIGDHLDLFRRNQAAIGVDVMGKLPFEERDERLKHHLIGLKELHPALISPECQYKVLQRLVGGLLAVVLRPREAQSPLVRCIARELVTCLVIQPIMDFASPGYINELIEYIYLATNDDESKAAGEKQSPNVTNHTPHQNESTSKKDASSYNRDTAPKVTRSDNQKEMFLDASENLNSGLNGEEPMQPRPADWARMLEAATQRRTEVLMPENLENMWTKGRNYKRKAQKIAARRLRTQTQLGDGNNNLVHLSHGQNSEQSTGGAVADELEDTGSLTANGHKGGLRRSNSTSALIVQPSTDEAFRSESGGPIISEFYSPNFRRHNDVPTVTGASDMVSHGEGGHTTKLRCRVIGAYFEKLGSKSFAVYSIAVRDADKNTWIVKRRYRNFERLHCHLKDIPNYTLHLPPKRIFSSSTEDAFVRKRCIQLDKYMQDLLSIANVAEQHEVWDFLSVSSKNYSFVKSSSVMRTLAVNVDDAMEDIVRQFKGASDGLVQKVVGSYPPPSEVSPAIPTMNLSWNADEISKHLSWQNTTESAHSISDNEGGDNDGIHGLEEVGPPVLDNAWHSDNELNSKSFPRRVVKRGATFRSLNHEKKKGSDAKPASASLGEYPVVGLPITSNHLEDPVGVPLEWTPPNLTVPVLNLVDKMFQLKRRGWIRRQVFWISKQILQLMMEDAIDDWLLRQIQWLRRDDVIAQGIQWVQDVLWPDGTFFVRLNAKTEMDDFESNEASFQTTSRGSKVSQPGTFELQLEAARRASDVKKMIFNGTPTALVSLIGPEQYRRSARDIYYFLQSTICLKQLAYGILELVLISVFPELRDIVLDVHEKMRIQPV